MACRVKENVEDKKSVYESIRKFVEMINMGDVRCSRLRRYAEKILFEKFAKYVQ